MNNHTTHGMEPPQADEPPQTEEDNESSSGDSEEEVEPKLRYQRLKNDVPGILEADAASCMAVHTKFLAIGTHLGVIHILDHQGNNIRSKELVLHVTTVNHISIDEKGDYMASCSNDGKVVLHGMYSSDLNAVITIDRPVRSISLDPNFTKSSSNRRFIIGEDKVVLYEKFILTRYKSTVLYQGEGPIRNIRWKNNFVVWSSDKTVRLYDLLANVTVTVIQKDFDPVLRPALYRCNFYWKDSRTLLIGWGNAVKVCNVVPTDPHQIPLKTKDHPATPSFYVKITSLFNTNFCICGISSMGNDIVVLTVVKNAEVPGSVGFRPQLRVLQPNGEDFEPISSDILSLRGYKEYRCNDYHLGSLCEDGLYFILSPKDFVIATPRDEDDHVAWLIEHEQYKVAVDAVLESRNLHRHNLLGVGQIYLDHLLQLKEYSEAAKLCSTILGSNKQLWEEEVYKFAQIRQLCCIAPYLPIKESLDPTIYEMVLNEFLFYDPKGFLELIRKWPCQLYSIPAIVVAVKDRLSLSKQPSVELCESLCELFIYDGKYDEALAVYIEIKNKEKVFELIQNHNLFGNLYDKLETLIELNPTVATNILSENMDKIPIDLVVSKLTSKRKLLFEYLAKLFLRDSTLGEDYHGLLVELYAEYAPDQLLSFLRTSNNYALEHAYDVCCQRNLIHEMIFLLDHMGNKKQALQKIMHDLQDIERAINFCKEHDDKELWEDLIECSLDKSGFITVLLQNIGTHIDPIMLIQKIPNNKEIPGLRDSLVKILQDYNLQISLREGCEKILVADCFSLLEKLHKQQKKGILVCHDQVCQACGRKLLANASRTAVDIFVFNCRHAFHDECISHKQLDTCSICSAQKRRPGSKPFS